MKTTEKNCFNCKYFVAYYTKVNDRLHKTFNGHCWHSQIKTRKLVVRYDCEYWQSNENEVKERRAEIEKALLKMQKNIEDILIILKDDNAPE